ncbi:unnamed protein product [Mytilus coruscus]|uniref:Uncharacterized protein n=1 Tax=Mytilus coruscus TaxID=42192 RepID=A0A6J8ARI6_MYTCO|nr:unnamed protein product [Mytilus coruscus]
MVIGVASTDTLSYSVSSVDDSSVSTIQVINATSSSPSKVNKISMTYFTDNTLNATFTTAAESITITDFTATALLTTIHESTQDMIVLSSNGIFSLENSLYMESDLSSETIQLPTTVLNNTSFTVIPSTGTNFLSSTDVLSLFPSTDIETGSDFFGSETMFDTNIYKSSASENNFSSVTASTVTVEANLSLTSEDLMPSVSFTTEKHLLSIQVLSFLQSKRLL